MCGRVLADSWPFTKPLHGVFCASVAAERDADAAACRADVLCVSTLLPELQPDYFVVIAPGPSLAPCFVLFCASAAGLGCGCGCLVPSLTGLCF